MRLLKWLFSWSGSVTREQCFVAGVLFTGMKFLLDKTIASRYGVDWQLWNYVLPTQHSYFRTNNASMYAVLWAVALPFFWIGIGLTLRRLRSAGRSPLAAALFFVPLLNLVFFLTLCLLPEQPGLVPDLEQQRETRRAIGSATAGLPATVLIKGAKGGYAGAIGCSRWCRRISNAVHSIFTPLQPTAVPNRIPGRCASPGDSAP